MTPEVSVIVVNYRSAPESARCVASLREAFARERIAGEILLVDCGSGRLEADALGRIPADVHIRLEENRGYSGGVNAGLARARSKTLILSNADVLFLPGALGGLLDAVDGRLVGAAAPLALWDQAGRVRLPPGYAPGLARDFAQRLGGRFRRLDDCRFASFARETIRLWDRGGRARHLSGAVLAVRRDVFDRVGRFDERFLFEYEETEWQDRVRAAGLRLEFVASARVRHFWGGSAAENAETSARRALSERLYRRRRYGKLAATLLEKARSGELAFASRSAEPPRVPAAGGAALAISPNPSRLPFAVAELGTEFRLPAEIVARMRPGPWYFTIFRTSDGRPLSNDVWEKAG